MIQDDLVIHELELTASPDAVFQMFVDPEMLVRWIGISADLEPLPGGTFRFEIEPGQFCEGEYVEVDPPRRLVFTWGWTDPWFGLPPGFSRVEVDLQASGGGTRLRLVHRQLPGQIRLLHDQGWATFLRRLDDVLAARPVSAYLSQGGPPPSRPSPRGTRVAGTPLGTPQERQAKL